MTRGLAAAAAAGVLAAAPCGVMAQAAPPADGIKAFVKGDYATAVEILRPAAERWQPPRDDMSAFFMAIMYDNGLGVPRDAVRACALLIRTSMIGPDPGPQLGFAMQTLTDDVRSRLSPEQMAECLLFADTGFDHGFQPVTFQLAADHWISLGLDLSVERQRLAARIVFGGKETQQDLPLQFRRGSRFLRFSVSEVTSLRPRPVRRHFLEAFAWQPVGDGWTLTWTLFEVVRERLIHVTAEEVQTVGGDQPPSYDGAALARLATVRVTANGDAEWAVLTGKPRSDVIETDDERRERAAEAFARQSAERQVDRSLRRSLGRAPSLVYQPLSSYSCWGTTYSSSPDRTEAITLRLGRARLTASASTITFDLTTHPDLDVTVHVYESAPRGWPFCDDVVRPDPVVGKTWKAVAGVVAIDLAPVFRIREPDSYRATIRLTGAEFISATGARVRQSQPITLSTIVQLPQ